VAEPFGDRDKRADIGRRPTSTIEGTASEVSVEPAPGEVSVEPAPGEAGDAEGAGASPRSNGEPTASPESSVTEPVAPEAALGDPEGPVGPREPKPRVTMPPRTSAAEFRSFLTHLAAGLLGGLIGVLALAFAWNKLPIRAAGAPEMSSLQRRLDTLEAQRAPAGDAKAIDRLEQRVKGLEERKVEAPAELSGLTSRITRLEAALDALGKTAEAGGSVPDAAAIETRIGDMEQRLRTELDATLGTERATNSESLETLKRDLADLRAELGALAEAKLAADDAGASPELAALDQRVAKLEAALPDLSTAIRQGAASARSGTAVIALNNLREAVGAGRPYAAELAAFRALAPQIGELEPLPAHAQTGIPTVPELAQKFRQLADARVSAAPNEGKQSLLDSMIASAKSAIRIRRIDAATDSADPGAVLARAETRVNQGDLEAAVEAVEALPAPSREAFAGWLEEARARTAAEQTLSNLESALLSSMARATGEAKP
jgi:hypothetical protein